MRAAQVRASRGVEVVDVPVPEPGPTEVLLRVQVCGLCQIDAQLATGSMALPGQGETTRVLGHEGVGVVEAVGAAARLDPIVPQVGSRVAVGWLARTCGTCRYCLSGREALCPAQQNLGYSVDGAMAEYVAVAAGFVTPVPDDVSSVDAAVLSCAGVNALRAVRAANVRPGDRVAVFGVGGLGHLAVQYARAAGGIVVAVDVEEHKLDVARALGADHTVNSRAEDSDALGGVDVALMTVGDDDCYGHAFAALRPGGRMVCVGVPPGGTVPLPVHAIAARGLHVLGTPDGRRSDLAEALRLHEAGRTEIVADRRPLDQVGEAMEDLLTGKVPGRVVLEV